jgi:hypothetical protein
MPFSTSAVLAPLVARIRKSSSSFSKVHHTHIFLNRIRFFYFLFFSVYDQSTFLAFTQCFEEVSFSSHIIVKDPRSIFAMLTWDITWIFSDWLFLYVYLYFYQLFVVLVYIFYHVEDRVLLCFLRLQEQQWPTLFAHSLNFLSLRKSSSFCRLATRTDLLNC